MTCPHLIAAAVALFAVATAARGEIRTETVEYHDGATLCRGYLAYDDATADPRPGVLVCPEWWGLNGYVKHRAEMLAAQGYVAFVADIYGDGLSTADPAVAKQHAMALEDADRAMLRRRATAALTVLTDRKQVDKAHVAAIGYCFGGTVALELARGGSPVAAVVTFHGDLSRAPNEGPDHLGACKVLVCHGGADQLVPPAVVAAFEQEMVAEHADYQINIYGGAKHGFSNPSADSYHMPPVAYDASADHRSWQASTAFLADVLKPVSTPVR